MLAITSSRFSIIRIEVDIINIINERVRHSRFGEGTITEQTETLVSVVFDGGDIAKKFFYPAAFGQFLILCAPERQEKIEAELRLLREREEAKKKELREAGGEIAARGEKKDAQKRKAEKKRRAKPAEEEPEEAEPDRYEEED